MGKERAYSAKPSITSGDQCRASLPGLALLLSMGAGEAGGGKRGWWGQARPMGAVSHRPHARSLRPNATNAIGPNPVPTLLRSFSFTLNRYHKIRDEAGTYGISPVKQSLSSTLEYTRKTCYDIEGENRVYRLRYREKREGERCDIYTR